MDPDKNLLYDLAIKAYERELRDHLVNLAEKFDEWRIGAISSAEMDHYIHEYASGASRDIFGRYNELDADTLVARALAHRILERDEIPLDYLEALREKIDFFGGIRHRD